MKKLLIGMSVTVALLAGCSSSSSTDTTVALETTDTAAVTTAVVEVAPFLDSVRRVALVTDKTVPLLFPYSWRYIKTRLKF